MENAAEQTPQQQPVKTKNSSGVNKILIIVVIVLLLGLAGAAGYILKGSSQTNNQTALQPSATPSTQTTAIPTQTISQTASPSPTLALISYTSTQLANNGLKAYSISFPPAWVKTVTHDATSDTLTLTQNGYSISIYQAAYGGGGCTFSGDPQPMSEDMRNKPFVDIMSGIGQLRRYQADAAQSKPGMVTFGFCQSTDGTSFGKPTSVGMITYQVPQSYAASFLTDMDAIIKTLTVAK